jgi:hypothetical protein
MVRRVAYLTAASGLALLLAGCAFNFLGEQRAAWRAGAERACMTRQEFASSAFIREAKQIDGRGSCGIAYPLRVSAFAEGSVAVGPSATLGCPITEGVEGWLRDSIQPAAIAWFGVPVVELRQISDYSCRSRNNIRGASLSEHAFGNALDVAGFVLEDGRIIMVRTGWRGSPREQGFLREIEAAACQRFATVLGPGAPYHGDHLHVDLARRGRSGASGYCDPSPQVVPPVRAPYLPSRVAGSPARAPAFTGSIAPAYDPFAMVGVRANETMSLAE